MSPVTCIKIGLGKDFFEATLVLKMDLENVKLSFKLLYVDWKSLLVIWCIQVQMGNTSIQGFLKYETAAHILTVSSKPDNKQ